MRPSVSLVVLVSHNGPHLKVSNTALLGEVHTLKFDRYRTLTL